MIDSIARSTEGFARILRTVLLILAIICANAPSIRHAAQKEHRSGSWQEKNVSFKSSAGAS
jgi:hypothetical protein